MAGAQWVRGQLVKGWAENLAVQVSWDHQSLPFSPKLLAPRSLPVSSDWALCCPKPVEVPIPHKVLTPQPDPREGL